jgi:phage terminase small subunit
MPQKNKAVKSRGLTAKQATFVREYLVDFNASKACVRAGYTTRNPSRVGPELLGKTCVAEAIAKLRDKADSRAVATARELRELWSEFARNPEMSAKDRLKATELLGRTKAMFVDRKEISGKGGAPIQVETVDLTRLSDDEIAAIRTALGLA